MSMDYTYFEYDSCTEGLDSDEEVEIDNVFLQDLLEETADFDVDFDIIESYADSNIAVDKDNEAGSADFAAGDVPTKKRKAVQGKDRHKRKLPSSSTTTTTYKH